MKDAIKRYAARLTIAATREASRLLPKPAELTGADIKAVEMMQESQWHHFGILDNPYTEDDLRWIVWDRKAVAKINQVRADHGDKQLIAWNGEYQYV